MQFLANIEAPWIYLIIFFGKIVEVAVSTTRVVLIGRGERVIGSLLALIEITFWVLITSTVLAGISTDIWKAVVYIIAFGCGVYVGSWMEEKLAFGMCSMNMICPDIETAQSIATALRAHGFGVTLLDAKGMDNDSKYVLMLMLKRKDTPEAQNVARQLCPSCLVTVADVSSIKGGFLRSGGGVSRGLKRMLFK